MPFTAISIRLAPTDTFMAARRPNGYLSLTFAGTVEVEIPPQLAASLFAGLISVMAPTSAEVVPFPQSARALQMLFDGSSEIHRPCDSEGAA